MSSCFSTSVSVKLVLASEIATVNLRAYKAGYLEKQKRGGLQPPLLPPLRIHPRQQDGVFCGFFVKLRVDFYTLWLGGFHDR